MSDAAAEVGGPQASSERLEMSVCCIATVTSTFTHTQTHTKIRTPRHMRSTAIAAAAMHSFLRRTSWKDSFRC